MKQFIVFPFLSFVHHYWLFTDPAVDSEHMVDWETAMKEANADSMKIMEQYNGELAEIKKQAE